MVLNAPPMPLMTAEDLLKFPREFRCELIEGRVVPLSPAGDWHGSIALTIGRIVGNHVHEHRLGRTFAAETGFQISTKPDTIRAPDVSVVLKSRVRTPGTPGFFKGAPDLAVEVASPGDTIGELDDKARMWLAAGCSEVWVAKPAEMTVTIYGRSAPGEPLLTLRHDETLTDCPVLPGFACRVGEFFE